MVVEEFEGLDGGTNWSLKKQEIITYPHCENVMQKDVCKKYNII